jgi:hypothetical protein
MMLTNQPAHAQSNSIVPEQRVREFLGYVALFTACNDPLSVKLLNQAAAELFAAADGDATSENPLLAVR